MTAIEKRLLAINSLVGAGLTVLVVIAMLVGVLDAMDRWLYDRRARDNQRFNEPPTDTLVHVDIDDLSLEAIGRWPWDRRLIGYIVEELNRAGAKAIAMDILFSEPQPITLGKESDGQIIEYDNDQLFADAIARHGNVILPTDFRPIKQIDPMYAAAARVIEQDLTVSHEQVADQLAAAGVISTPRDLPLHFFLAARREAFFHHIDAELADDLTLTQDDLRERMLPHLDQQLTVSPELIILREQLIRAKALRTLRQFSRPVPADELAIADSAGTLPPVPQLAAAVAGTGFVFYDKDADGVIRTVPFWFEYDGRLYPQLALALACKQLDVDLTDPDAIHVSEAGTELRLPDGTRRRIPLYPRYSHGLGRPLGEQLYIPWFGRPNDWQTTWDYPDHQNPTQHLPAVFVYDIHRTRHRLEINGGQIREAVIGAEAVEYDHLSDDGRAKIKALWEQPWPALDDVAGWVEHIDRVVNKLKQDGWYEAYATLTDSEVAEILANAENEEDRRATAWKTNSIRGLAPLRRETLKLQSELAVLEKRLADQVRGKSVLIGSVATANFDVVTTSIHSVCPGVVVHGIVYNAVMTGDILYRAPLAMTVLLTVIIGLPATAASAALSPGRALAAAVVLGVGYFFINGFVLFDYYSLVVGAAGPLTAVVVVWGGCTLTRFVTERLERARVTRAFQSYVDPALVSYVIENPKQARLDGQTRELTVVFTDLAGFTTLSEKLQEETVPLLNDYMSLMVPVIRGHNGYVNKFLGDGLMFFYGAPLESNRHALDAVSTVLQMQVDLQPFNQSLVNRHLPRVQMRAGLASGHMIVGNAGSVNARDPANVASDYTVLGDTVNLGARLESANKATGTLVMINDRCAQMIHDDYLVRPIGKLQVVGKTEGVMTWEPLIALADATDEQKRYAQLWHDVVDPFIEGRFNDVLLAIDAMDQETGVTKLTELYRRLSMQYLTDAPPDNFDGSIVLESK